MTETSPRRHRDKTETSPNTETSPKPDRDKTETSPRQDRDMTETSPRQDRDILGEFFSGAWAAPGRLIHVRPQAYRYWGITIHKYLRKAACICLYMHICYICIHLSIFILTCSSTTASPTLRAKLLLLQK